MNTRDQLLVLEGFRRFHARSGRLPSSAEAQAAAGQRPPEITSYRETMRAFPGKSWREIRQWAARELGLELQGVTKRRHAVRAPPGRAAAPSPATTKAAGPLTDAQFELLWEVCRQPRLYDHLDGRTVQALGARGLAVREGEWVHGTERSRTALRTHLTDLARTTGGRAASIYRALSDLEAAVMPGAEVHVGQAIAYADDVLLGLYRKARTLRAAQT